MNEEMKQAWLEISRMLGEPTREELDVFLRTWQRAMEAQKRPAQQEPVACPTCGEYEPRTGTCGTSPNDKRALCNRNAPQPAQQEPVAKHYVDGGHLVYPKAQRTWVGLTDEERDAMIGATDLSGTYYYDDLYAVILLAEGKLKEKNT